MTDISTIQSALAAVPRADFRAAAERLLNALGYRSDLKPEASGDVDEFIGINPDTRSKSDFSDNARSVHIIFQVTDAEIAPATQTGLFDPSAGYDAGNNKSFIFVAVELAGDSYPRGQYADFTREINKSLNTPAVVLFKTADHRLTLAFVHRRPHKRAPERDVLGSVSLIREMDPADPHRAHLDILSELSLEECIGWMGSRGKSPDFDGLLEAWLYALDTEELNRRFYNELFDWFERAVREAKFPKDQPVTLPPEEHVIRLITRLLFTWFIKEKGLIAEDLFIENRVRPLLKGYDRDSGDSYYRAVLQNLFFATLNSEIASRRFSAVRRSTYRDFSLYRYKKEMADPDALLELFSRTPFINGGLFDCLDTFESATQGGYRIDCFTDNVTNPRRRNDYGLLSIPNRLFFDHNGLIPLFERYKFTVEENTPAEREVALDPELLGKVFENLLAEYNPETSETARKQTGSYYTPRSVVDYMVDEALVAALAERADPTDGDSDSWRIRLHNLLDYEYAFDDASDLFGESETAALIRAISEIKVIDPAVGSGAFPMGVLHKLTLALRRLDPENQRWEELQKELARRRAAAAFDTHDQTERDEELAEISDTFEKYRESDFGRKLYLIQNSIFGVDIQPVACQIAKLRFFISLAIEQQPDPDTYNYGIKPLPNLETRFVAANTLIPLHGQQSMLTSPQVEKLQKQLRENGERHFHANTRSKKQECIRQDNELRNSLATELKQLGMPSSDADKYANWNRYDQNAKADWFDAYYMFGIPDGFDIVIGNPPYRQVRKGIHSKAQFPYSEGKDKGKQNLYKLFVEQSYNLCKPSGLATLIVQSSLMCDLSSAATRELLLEHTRLHHIIEFPKAASTREAQLFQNVTQGTCVYQFTKASPQDDPIKISVGNDIYTISDLNFASITRQAILALYPDLHCFPHIRSGSVEIMEKVAGDKDIKPLRDYMSSIAQGDLNLTTHSSRFSTEYSSIRLLRGRNVSRFVVKYNTAVEYCDEGFMTEKVIANRNETFLISQQVTGTNDVRRLHFGLAENPPTDFLCGNSVNKTQLKCQEYNRAFLSLLNSKFMDWFFRITSTNNHVQGYELEQLPIPEMSKDDRKRLENIADRILAAKSENPSADTTDLEEEIDRLVYDLYNLTPEETAAIEAYF